MAISFVAAALTNPPGANMAVTANLPTGFAAADVLVMYATINKNPAAITVPAGWTVIDGPITETAANSLALYRVADGTETAPIVSADTSGQWRVDVAAYRGVDNSSPFLAHGGRVETGGSTTMVHTAPTLTNTDANAWGVFCGAFRQVPTPASWTPGAGLTERTDADTGNSTTANLTQCLDDTNGTLATGNYTFSGTSSSGSAQVTTWAALLRPASAGGTPGLGSGSASFTLSASGSGTSFRSGSGSGSAAFVLSASGVGVAPPMTPTPPRHKYIAVTVSSDGTTLAIPATTNSVAGAAYGLGTQPLGTSPLGGQAAVVNVLPVAVALASDGTSQAVPTAQELLDVVVHTID